MTREFLLMVNSLSKSDIAKQLSEVSSNYVARPTDYNYQIMMEGADCLMVKNLIDAKGIDSVLREANAMTSYHDMVFKNKN